MGKGGVNVSTTEGPVVVSRNLLPAVSWGGKKGTTRERGSTSNFPSPEISAVVIRPCQTRMITARHRNQKWVFTSAFALKRDFERLLVKKSILFSSTQKTLTTIWKTVHGDNVFCVPQSRIRT